MKFYLRDIGIAPMGSAGMIRADGLPEVGVVAVVAGRALVELVPTAAQILRLPDPLYRFVSAGASGGKCQTTKYMGFPKANGTPETGSPRHSP